MEPKVKIPYYVQILAKLIPILKWEDESNLAKGEIVKFDFVERDRNKHKFNDQVVGSEGDYDCIWRHISDDYFKLIGKAYGRTC